MSSNLRTRWLLLGVGFWISIASVHAESTSDSKSATKVPTPSRLQKRMESEMELPIKVIQPGTPQVQPSPQTPVKKPTPRN